MKLFRNIVFSPLTFSLVLYYFVLSFVNSFTQFVINDEWAHTRQVEAFLHHSWKIQSNTDASLILLAYLGFFYSLIFGYSLIKLKILVFISSFILITFLYKTLKLFTQSYRVQTLFLLTLIFNPLFLHLGNIFMTDIPFLALLSISLYFYIKSVKENSAGFALLGTVFSGFSILIRQSGVFILFSWFIYKFVVFLIEKNGFINLLKSVWKEFLIGLVFVSIYVFYPRFGGSAGAHIIEKLINPALIKQKLIFLLNSLIYLSYFILPVVVFIKTPKNLLKNIPLMLSAVLLGYYIYRNNVFPTGNIIYLEGLYAKSSQFFSASVVNNNIFKLGLSLLVGYSMVKAALALFYLILKKSKSRSIIFLLITVLVFYISLSIPNDQYDRYTLPLFYILLIVFSTESTLELNGNKINLLVYLKILLVLSIFYINYSLVLEFYSNNNLRWKAAKLVTQNTGKRSKIFVNGTYTRYISAQKIKDYSGELYVSTQGQYDCASETMFTKSEEQISLESIIQKYSKYLDDRIGKPSAVQLKIPTSMGIPRAKEYQRDIYFEEEYPSIFYNLYGYKVKVQGWCDKRRI